MLSSRVVFLPILPEVAEATELGRIPKRGVDRAAARLAAEFGKKLRDARRSHKLSQEALGKLVNMDRGEISKIETGARPNLETATMTRLGEALGFDINILVTPRRNK